MKYKILSNDEKLKIVEEGSTSGVNETCIKYGISISNYYNWQKKFHPEVSEFGMGLEEIQLKKINDEIISIVKNNDEIKSFYKIPDNFTFEEFFNNKMLVIQTIREGIPYSLFLVIKNFTPFNDHEWISFLDISIKSIQRIRQSVGLFKPAQSERIIEVAEVCLLGYHIFGKMENFKSWLHTPVFALGNIKPVEFLNDSYGKEMIMGELTRIEHGIFA